jgi:hypothetical protein
MSRLWELTAMAQRLRPIARLIFIFSFLKGSKDSTFATFPTLAILFEPMNRQRAFVEIDQLFNISDKQERHQRSKDSSFGIYDSSNSYWAMLDGRPGFVCQPSLVVDNRSAFHLTAIEETKVGVPISQSYNH